MKKQQIILLHVVFWSVMLITIGLESIPLIGKTPINAILLDNLIYAVSFISLFYLYYVFISEKHLEKRKFTYLIIFGLLFVLLITVPVTLIFIYFLYEKVYDLSGKEFLFEFRTFYFRILETNFMFVVAGSLLKIALLRYKSVMKQKELEKQFVSNELALLRSQINPQFLFNTLTIIKSQIELQSEKAIYGIEKLSEIMSYMLYETSDGKVLLESEIKNINNYLNLQKIRYNPDIIDFEVSGDTAGKFVPPLLFMPFIENVFKFGNSFTQLPGIIIKLFVKENNLTFEVTNHQNKNSRIKESEEDFNIKLIKRRLDLLYENNYTLEIKNESSEYSVRLIINPSL